MTAETVLVTGAFGLVGSETVQQLMVEGPHVVATDLDVPANRKAAESMPPPRCTGPISPTPKR